MELKGQINPTDKQRMLHTHWRQDTHQYWTKPTLLFPHANRNEGTTGRLRLSITKRKGDEHHPKKLN